MRLFRIFVSSLFCFVSFSFADLDINSATSMGNLPYTTLLFPAEYLTNKLNNFTSLSLNGERIDSWNDLIDTNSVVSNVLSKIPTNYVGCSISNNVFYFDVGSGYTVFWSNNPSQFGTLTVSNIVLNSKSITDWGQLTNSFVSISNWVSTNYLKIVNNFEGSQKPYTPDLIVGNLGASELIVGNESSAIQSWMDLTNWGYATIGFVTNAVGEVTTNYLPLTGGTVSGTTTFEDEVYVGDHLYSSYIEASDDIYAGGDVSASGSVAGNKLIPTLANEANSVDQGVGLYDFRIGDDFVHHVVLNSSSNYPLYLRAGNSASIFINPSSFSDQNSSISMVSYNLILDAHDVTIGNRSNDSVVGSGSVSIGERNVASGIRSYAFGTWADATNNSSFVFHDTRPASLRYGSHGNHTFNINPQEGLNGFWIGETNMYDHLVSFFSGNTTNFVQKTGDTMSGSLTIGTRNPDIVIGSNSFVQGITNMAIGDYSHAEGNNTLAYGKYSHAEGMGWSYPRMVSASADSSIISISGGAISEEKMTGAILLFENKPFLITNVDEGTSTITIQGILGSQEIVNENAIIYIGAIGESSHVEGHRTLASGKWSHAEGHDNVAFGQFSHAEGSGNIALGQSSHAEGISTISSGLYSHSDGKYAIASNNYSYVWSGDTNGSSSSMYGSHGYGTFNINPTGCTDGFYIGETNLTDIIASYLTGLTNFVEKTGDTINGNLTIRGSVLTGDDTSASGNYSHAEGWMTSAAGDYAHAEGIVTVAEGFSSHASGIKAYATNDYSYAWNGVKFAYNYLQYGSHGDGTYNVNPTNCLEGFYIGETNLHDHIVSISKNTKLIQTMEYEVKEDDVLVWMDAEAYSTASGGGSQTVTLPGLLTKEFATVTIRRIGSNQYGPTTITFGETTSELTKDGDTFTADWVLSAERWIPR